MDDRVCVEADTDQKSTCSSSSYWELQSHQHDDTDTLALQMKTSTLRFGIDAILMVKPRVTYKETITSKEQVEHQYGNTTCMSPRDQYGNTTCMSPRDCDQHQTLGKDNTKSPPRNDKYFVPDNLKNSENVKADVSSKDFTVAFSSLCSNSASLATQQPLLPLLNSVTPWARALLSDIRKERFTSVRRVGHPYQNRTPPKRKKPRTSFTRVQIVELEKRFEKQKYLASTERSSLAKSLSMSDAQVKTWFQNRRTKWRRQTAEERELERQAANRLLLGLQADADNRKAMMLSPGGMCLTDMQRFHESSDTWTSDDKRATL